MRLRDNMITQRPGVRSFLDITILWIILRFNGT